MTIEDKNILINEIKNYKGSTSLIEMYKLLKDEKLRKKVLIQNETGIVGNLLDKYKDEIDDEIIKEICVREYVNNIYYDKEELMDDIKKLSIAKDIEWIINEFHKEKEVILYAVIENGELLDYYQDNIKDDKEFIKRLICDYGRVDSLMYASEDLKKDKELVLEAVKNYGRALQYASEELKKDKEFILNAIKYDVEVLYCVCKELLDDKDIILEGVKLDADLLKVASEELKKDKEVVLEAVKNNGYALLYASEELQNDKEIVLEAVKNDSCAFECIDKELQKDKDIVLEALNGNLYNIIDLICEELFDDKDIMLKIVKQDGYYLKIANEELRKDKEVVIEAVKSDPFALRFASKELQNDIEFITSIANKQIEVYVSKGMYNNICSIYNDNYVDYIKEDTLVKFPNLILGDEVELTDEDLSF